MQYYTKPIADLDANYFSDYGCGGESWLLKNYKKHVGKYWFGNACPNKFKEFIDNYTEHTVQIISYTQHPLLNLEDNGDDMGLGSYIHGKQSTQTTYFIEELLCVIACMAESKQIHIDYVFDSAQQIEKVQKLCERLQTFCETATSSNTINLLCQSQHGLYLKECKINKPAIDIAWNYNDDILNKHDRIVDILTDADKGILLLHGPPGTGKSTYIRYLMHSEISKRTIFVPPGLARAITEPGFLTFLLKYPNSILIVEDAEEILEQRQQGVDNAAVSNILNLSDGLLSDTLNIQFICTFNCEVGKIDEAITRNGRLIDNVYFGPLEASKANKLAEFLKLDHRFNVPVEIAKIYDFNSKSVEDNLDKDIGFTIL